MHRRIYLAALAWALGAAAVAHADDYEGKWSIARRETAASFQLVQGEPGARLTYEICQTRGPQTVVYFTDKPQLLSKGACVEIAALDAQNAAVTIRRKDPKSAGVASGTFKLLADAETAP